MKTFTISAALALMASLASAAPSPAPVEARQFEAQITFIGAGPDPTAPKFTESVPTDGTYFPITYPGTRFAISHIRSEGGATCTFYGDEGSVTTLIGAQTVDVGPPQPQGYGFCRAL